MAVVVNNPNGTTEGTGSGTNSLLAIILVLAAVFFLLYYGIPAFRGGSTSGTGSQVNIPDKVDVNVNNPSGQ